MIETTITKVVKCDKCFSVVNASCAKVEVLGRQYDLCSACIFEVRDAVDKVNSFFRGVSNENPFQSQEDRIRDLMDKLPKDNAPRTMPYPQPWVHPWTIGDFPLPQTICGAAYDPSALIGGVGYGIGKQQAFEK